MNDPYRVLGVSPNATDDEIKEAYRALAKKYHPDNYAGSPIADLASEKMKEVNEAYDQITSERKAARKRGNSGPTGNTQQQAYNGYWGGAYQTSTGFGDVRSLIASGRIALSGNVEPSKPERVCRCASLAVDVIRAVPFLVVFFILAVFVTPLVVIQPIFVQDEIIHVFRIGVLFVRLVNVHRLALCDFYVFFYVYAVSCNSHLFIIREIVGHFRDYFINTGHQFVNSLFRPFVRICLIRMVVREQLGVLAWIIFKPRLRLVSVT